MIDAQNVHVWKCYSESHSSAQLIYVNNYKNKNEKEEDGFWAVKHSGLNLLFGV